MDTSQREIVYISQILKTLGFNLDKEQPHISGERFLASPDKLVLVGEKVSNGLRVIIKMSRLIRAKQEIRQEKKIRDILSSFPLFNKAILIPKEICFCQKGPYNIFVTEFIPQKRIFVSYPLKKQLSIILKIFRAKEKFNGNTFKRILAMFETFPYLRAKDYLENYKKFQASTLLHYRTPGIEEAMRGGLETLGSNESVIEKYSNYLVHTDFAPHNFRIVNDSLYTLDFSAFLFGNKYEELARLLNYMVIHNPALEKKLKSYILEFRGETEYLDLKLMRIYKIGHLLKYYTQSLPKTSYDLLALTIHRIEFWEEVLRCIMQDKPLDEGILKVYLENRDNLRSAEEKIRQRGFAKA